MKHTKRLEPRSYLVMREMILQHGDMTDMTPPIDWFTNLSLGYQILLVFLGVTIAVLALIGVFYLIKYIFLGLGKGAAAVGKGVGKVAKAIFAKQEVSNRPLGSQSSGELATPQPPESRPYYCSLCGHELPSSLITRLLAGESGFCENCGAQISLPETN